MKKVILFFILLFNFYYVKAYENNYFSITIPDEYKIIDTDNGIYKWEKDNKYISITVSDNVNGYSIKNYTDDDINNQKKYIEDNINISLVEYDTKVSVTDIQKNIINNMYTLSYTIYWPSKEQTGYDIYQYGNVISTDNYIYTIVYNTNASEIDKDFDVILNSFVPNDLIGAKNNPNFMTFIVVLIAFIFAIIRIIKKYKKKN